MVGRRDASARAVAIVVGAGIGGLAAALELASQGLAVTVLERSAVPGGKARSQVVAGRTVDVGPTVLTMRWVFDALFRDTGADLASYVTLEPIDVIARHAWPDGSELDLFADRARTIDAIGTFAGAAEAKRYRAFSDYAREIWEVAKDPFVLSQRPSWADVLRHAGTHGLRAMMKIDGHRTMWRAIEASFTDVRLRQLFGRYATYCGASPYEAPATFNLVSHVESEGVCRVVGGLSALAQGLATRAQELGATFRYETEVEAIVATDAKVTGVKLASGDVLEGDVVLVNADVSALATGRFGKTVIKAATGTPPDARSFSALTWAMVAKTEGRPLHHHNVAFSTDYAAEFADLIEHERAPREPTVYVCAQDRSTGRNEGATDLDDERLLLVVNAPATGDRPALWNDEERTRCEAAALSALRRCDLRIEPRASVLTTPVELEHAYPATGGALYGPRPKGPLSSFAREGARSKLPGLYFAGGSVHPGAGVPMVALSGRLAAASVQKDLASTGRSRPRAISRTTSMG